MDNMRFYLIRLEYIDQIGVIPNVSIADYLALTGWNELDDYLTDVFRDAKVGDILFNHCRIVLIVSAEWKD